MLISAGHIWLNHQLHRDIGLRVKDGIIEDIAPLGDATADHHVPLVLPLLTDLQVNGGGGTMVNSDPTPEGLRKVANAHRGLGTGTILPTVITDRHEVIEAATYAALALKDEDTIGGIHIEGPHLDLERRGTHNPKDIRPLDRATVDLVCDVRRQGLNVMLTLAPEHADPDLFAELAASGAVLSAGHSKATAEQTRHALEAGLGCFTHLYNAMPPMTSRDPGLLGTALNSTAYAGIIVDGIHVSWDMVRIALRSRPRSGLTFAVSDAMATVGGPDHFTLYGQDIHVKDGALVNAEGSLAGAHIDLVQSLANLVRQVGLPLAEAIPMVSDIPRQVMDLPPLTPCKGMPVSALLTLDDAFQTVTLT